MCLQWRIVKLFPYHAYQSLIVPPPLPYKRTPSPAPHLDDIPLRHHIPTRLHPPSAHPSPYQRFISSHTARSTIRLQTPQSSTRLPQHTANPTRQLALERFQSCHLFGARLQFHFPFKSTGVLSCEITVDVLDESPAESFPGYCWS